MPPLLNVVVEIKCVIISNVAIEIKYVRNRDDGSSDMAAETGMIPSDSTVSAET